MIPDKESPIPPVAIPSFPDPFMYIFPFILEVVVRNPFNTVTTWFFFENDLATSTLLF